MPIGFTFPHGFELPPGLVAAPSEASSSQSPPTQTSDTFTTPAADRTTASAAATTALVDMSNVEGTDADLSTQRSSAAHPAALSLLSLSQMSQSSADDGARPDWYVNYSFWGSHRIPSFNLPVAFVQDPL
jgi:hypothetical protein